MKTYYKSFMGYLEIKGIDKIEKISLSTKKGKKTKKEWSDILDLYFEGKNINASQISNNFDFGDMEEIYPILEKFSNSSSTTKSLSNFLEKTEKDGPSYKIKKILLNNELLIFNKKHIFSEYIFDLSNSLEKAIFDSLNKFEDKNLSFFDIQVGDHFQWEEILNNYKKLQTFEFSDNHISYYLNDSKINIFFSDDKLYVNHSSDIKNKLVMDDVKYRFNIMHNRKKINNYFEETPFESVIKSSDFSNQVYCPNILEVISHSIISQMISTKAANTIYRRFLEITSDKDILTFPNASRIISIGESKLAKAGLGNYKSKVIIDIAEMVNSNILDLDELSKMEPSEISDKLIKIKGIGPWTVNIVLIFCLKFDNLFLWRDLGIRDGLKKLFKLEERPNKKETLNYVKNINEYNSFLCLSLWNYKSKI